MTGLNRPRFPLFIRACYLDDKEEKEKPRFPPFIRACYLKGRMVTSAFHSGENLKVVSAENETFAFHQGGYRKVFYNEYNQPPFIRARHPKHGYVVVRLS